jgi:hypothetical protein
MAKDPREQQRTDAGRIGDVGKLDRDADREPARARPTPAAGRRRPVSAEELRERLERERQAAIDELRRLGVSADLEEARPRELDPASITEAGDAAQASERRDLAYARRERLAALPEARTCLACQERVERGGGRPDAA